MMKVVAIGSNEVLDYAFSLPLAMMMWHPIGYHPVAVLTEDEEYWHNTPLRAHVVRAAKRFGRVVYVGAVPGVDSASVSQLARLFMHCTGLWNATTGGPNATDDTLVIPSDADLWPLETSFYHQHDPEKHAVGLYYPNGTGEEHHFAMCHISMSLTTSAEVLGGKGETLNEAVRRVFATERQPEEYEGLPAWMFDQKWVSRRIVASRFYPDNTIKINRDGLPPKDRIDREKWPASPNISGMTDAHLPRVPYHTHWESLLSIIHQRRPCEVEWAKQYRQQFVSLIGEK